MSMWGDMAEAWAEDAHRIKKRENNRGNFRGRGRGNQRGNNRGNRGFRGGFLGGGNRGRGRGGFNSSPVVARCENCDKNFRSNEKPVAALD